jgi:predicted CXXCH cytochrome family protein
MYDSTPTSLLKTAPPASIDAKMRLQPESSSKMCLSCHDGTVAHENFGDLADGAIPPHGDALTSADLGMDHPISFVYDTSLSVIERDLYDPATKLSGIVGSMGTINDDMLFEGRMECSTCHDVHNKRAVAGTKLLLKDNAGSSLCLTCHDK